MFLKKPQREVLKMLPIHSIGDMMSQKNDKSMELEMLISFVSNLYHLVLVPEAKDAISNMTWMQGNNIWEVFVLILL